MDQQFIKPATTRRTRGFTAKGAKIITSFNYLKCAGLRGGSPGVTMEATAVNIFDPLCSVVKPGVLRD